MVGNLYIMIGAPGSGKSTWIRNHIGFNATYVSRDEIRFSMVKENEEYFSKEKQVFKEFTNCINRLLEMGQDVYADATHLNRAARNKLLKAINKVENVIAIWIDTPFEECLKNNEKRKGTRGFVPETAIRNMYNRIEAPNFNEGIDSIYIVKNGNVTVINKEN